jgi:hypothetical protein
VQDNQGNAQKLLQAAIDNIFKNLGRFGGLGAKPSPYAKMPDMINGAVSSVARDAIRGGY